MNMPPTQQEIRDFREKYKVSMAFAKRTLVNDYLSKEIEDIKKPSIKVSGDYDSLEGKLHRLTSIVEYLITQI